MLLRAPLTADARLVLAMLTFAPRHAHLDQVLETFTDDLLDLVARDRADGMFRAIMNYAYRVSETAPRSLDAFFSGLGPEAKEAHMATTLEQSRAEGRAEGAAQALRRLLAKRFGPLSAEQDARIQAAAPEEIDTWIDRFSSAATIDDILR